MLCASDWKHSCGPRRLLLAALLSLTVAKNAVAPQADPSSINDKGGRDWGADESGASSSGQNRRRGGKMHSTAVRADVKRLLGSRKTLRHVEVGWQAGSLSASGGCVQAIYEGMDPRRSEGLGDED